MGFLKKSNQSINTSQSVKKIPVTASFYPLYFFAGQIGGDKAEVRNLTPAGVEPHNWEPAPQDIARIEKSKLLILNGIMEAWGDKVKNNLQGKQVTVVAAGEGLFKSTEVGQMSSDPHVWLSPPLAEKQVEVVTRGFIKVDPSNTAYYETNQKKLDDRLDQLDQAYKQGLSNCIQRDIITSHAAFGYLAGTYGLNQVSIAGLSPEAEPSSRQLAKIASFAKSNNVKYIFFEKSASPKLSETLAREIGAQTLVLDPLEGLSEDDIKIKKDYFTVMEDNLRNLQTALQCSSDLFYSN